MKSVPKTIYKVCDVDLWAQAERDGEFTGAEIDISDGFIHFSTDDQVASTLAKHFSGRDGLVLVAIDADAVNNIIYEEARGGDLFPHLYEPLKLAHVLWVKPLVLDDNGKHIVPALQS